ncbi:IS110 family transposase [Amycolatopsis sp. RM579]|uniref:IS110 family transposase n=1 Tax=Amycolatopsis pithecellobii TaxID=664692 RepID=A0A6N7Z866_9PSEU|nr:IS110 family transposase [Amycolatopsis pithecellobii]
MTCDNRRTSGTDRPLGWVGIDVGKATHHACVMDPAGTVVFSQKLANDQAAIEQQVVYVPGRVVNRMTGVFRGEAKSDAKDARVIAETARMRTDLTPVTATDDLVVELTRLTAHREDLMADWVRGVNRLREMLTGIFPALERAFDYSTRSALILVTGFQTPQAIRDAGKSGVDTYLPEHGAWAKGIPRMAADALATAGAQTLRLPGEQTTAALIARLAQQLLDLDRQTKDTDKLITSRFREHPQAEIIESLPGLGPILGAEFLVATGGDLAAFATSGRLASYAGLAPVPQDSGRVTGNLRRPKRYNRRLLRDRRKFTPTAPQPATAAA